MGKKKGRRHKSRELQPSDEQADNIAPQVREAASDSEEGFGLYDPQNVVNRPAYDTKHLEELEYNVKELCE